MFSTLHCIADIRILLTLFIDKKELFDIMIDYIEIDEFLEFPEEPGE